MYLTRIPFLSHENHKHEMNKNDWTKGLSVKFNFDLTLSENKWALTQVLQKLVPIHTINEIIYFTSLIHKCEDLLAHLFH